MDEGAGLDNPEPKGESGTRIALPPAAILVLPNMLDRFIAWKGEEGWTAGVVGVRANKGVKGGFDT